MNLVGWFRQFWPTPAARRAVLSDYMALRDRKALLADIALRGNVWGASPPGLSAYDAGVAEGRRQVALEILRVVQQDPMQLLAFVEKKPLRQEP